MLRFFCVPFIQVVRQGQGNALFDFINGNVIIFPENYGPSPLIPKGLAKFSSKLRNEGGVTIKINSTLGWFRLQPVDSNRRTNIFLFRKKTWLSPLQCLFELANLGVIFCNV